MGWRRSPTTTAPASWWWGGDQAAVDRAAALAKEAGAKRCLPLKVSGPFHTSLLSPAGDALREKFQSVVFGPMAFPVIFNCLGREMGSEDTIPALLERQVQSSVYMEDTIRRMGGTGVDTIVEIGPGKALSGFVRKNRAGDQDLRCGNLRRSGGSLPGAERITTWI